MKTGKGKNVIGCFAIFFKFQRLCEESSISWVTNEALQGSQSTCETDEFLIGDFFAVDASTF